jgi:hypothetical protein
VLLFEFFPAFVATVSVVVAIWLYVVNQSAPDETAKHEQLRREIAERAAAARENGTADERGPHRPSMSA